MVEGGELSRHFHHRPRSAPRFQIPSEFVTEMEIGFVEFELVRSSRVDRAPATNEVPAKSSSKKRYSTVQYMWLDVLLVLQCTGVLKTL